MGISKSGARGEGKGSDPTPVDPRMRFLGVGHVWILLMLQACSPWLHGSAALQLRNRIAEYITKGNRLSMSKIAAF